jgi:iron complex outermembrane receptor protein
MELKISSCPVWIYPTVLYLVFGQIALANGYAPIEYESLNDGVPILVTPTRLKQSRHDIPASVTRIESKDLQALQIRTIPEALRYVAGMAVGYASGNQPRINYHGTNGLVPRRMQVLIDGISVYRSGYAEVTWPILPITIKDIRVIEVTRAPSSPTYGQNSMMAVINIITKESIEVQNPIISTRYGSQNTKDFYAQFGGAASELLSYRVSFAKEQDEGFDTNFRGEERHDGTDVNHFNAKSKIEIGSATDLRLFVGLSEGITELEYRDSRQLSYPDIDNSAQYYLADVRHVYSSYHELKLKTYYSIIEQDVSWLTCGPQALFLPSLRELALHNPDYAAAIVAGEIPMGRSSEDDVLISQVLEDIATLGAAAFEPTCGKANEDAVESKFDIEAEDTYLFSDNLRFVIGAGITQQVADSETFSSGRVDSWGGRLFGNSEYRWNKFVINLGAMIEEEEVLDTPEVSPRLGINYRVTPNNTIRYAVSRSIRTPDFMETDRDWNYLIEDLSVPVNGKTDLYFYHTAKADDPLVPEEIISHEMGWYGHYGISSSSTAVTSLEYDVKLFYDKMNNLISEKLQFFDYHPTNDSNNTLKGMELEIDCIMPGEYLSRSISNIKLHANYVYLDSDTNNFYERSLYARHTGALYAILYFQNNTHISLAYYGNSAMNGESFDGFEIAAGKIFKIGENSLNLNAKAVYYPDKENEFTVNETFNVQNNYTKTTSFYLTAEYRI